MRIILASTSPARRQLMKKLSIPFESVPPVCDETPLHNEAADALVARLSQIKAQSLVLNYPNSIIIGSDQVGVLGSHIIGKPHTIENAIRQLKDSSGKTVIFYTGMTVINTAISQSITVCETFKVRFRQLTVDEIRSYIKKDNPLQCAGSFRCDGLGITLFDKLEGDDINTLIGLPMLRLNTILCGMGVNPLLI